MRFLRTGTHLLAANELGQIVVFDIDRGQPIDIIQTCQQKAIWSLDVS